MSEKSTMLNELSVCKWVLFNRAGVYKYQVTFKFDTKEEALNKFRHDAYVIILILEKMCDEKCLNDYKKLYHRLKNEIIELPGDEE